MVGVFPFLVFFRSTGKGQMPICLGRSEPLLSPGRKILPRHIYFEHHKNHAGAGRSVQLALQVLLCVVALGFAKDAAASISYIQSASTAQSSGRTASRALPRNVTTGDLIIVGAFVTLGATVSVTDTLGDAFTQVAHQTVGSDHDADVFVGAVGTSGADTITVNAGSGKNVYAFSAHEYCGVSTAVDATSTAQGNSTAPASGSLTTVTSNDLIFAWFTNGSNFKNENFSSLNTAYTKREMSGSGTTQCYAFANCVESGDLAATTTLTTNATATLNVSDIWSATVVAFKGAGVGGTGAVASISPTSLTFASQIVGSTSAAQTITLNNTGNAALTLTSIALTGTNASDFAQTNNCGSSVANGSTCTISVTLKPTATGTRTAAVTFTDNATGSPQTVSLTGTGSNPVPATTNLSPTSATAGATAQTLTINGTGFLSSSTVTYNGVGHTAAYVSATQLSITLSTADQATAGTYAVVVTNPAPGGGTSNPLNFTVTANNPVPGITNLSPDSATAGAAAQALTINGTNFLASSTVTYNGAAHTAIYVSAMQLTINLSAGDQAMAGTYPVVVTNPAPGGGASNALIFTVNNPVPGITGLSPSSATAGAAAQMLTINGTGFLSSSTVNYNGAAHTATYVSASQLSITLTAADQAAAGTYAVVVTNPAPGGGASNTLNFTVNNPVPTITSLSPAFATAGAVGQTVTINGTNFLSSSTVTYNGVGHTATYVSATQLSITLSAGDQATAGTYPVVVTNPAPGGGASNALIFTVNNPVPGITSLSPSSATAGAAGQALTINGTNFLATSTVNYNGAAHTAIYVSAMQLIINLSAGDQATAGTYAVVVTNPSPGGGTSGPQNFAVDNPVPSITNLSPSSATAGAAGQTLTINGTNFLSSSTVTYNGTGHAATYVSATQLTITLSAADQATAGTYAVVVTNPAPGGGSIECPELHGHRQQPRAEYHEPFPILRYCWGSGTNADDQWDELPFQFHGNLQRDRTRGDVCECDPTQHHLEYGGSSHGGNVCSGSDESGAGRGSVECPELHGHSQQSRAEYHEPFPILRYCRGSGADADDQWDELPFHLDGDLQRGGHTRRRM